MSDDDDNDTGLDDIIVDYEDDVSDYAISSGSNADDHDGKSDEGKSDDAPSSVASAERGTRKRKSVVLSKTEVQDAYKRGHAAGRGGAGRGVKADRGSGARRGRRGRGSVK